MFVYKFVKFFVRVPFLVFIENWSLLCVCVRKIANTAISFIMSVCSSATTRLPLDGF